MSKIRTIATGLAATVAASLFTAVPPAHAAIATLNMAAVGDSFASGEGAIGSGWVDAGCHRSHLAGPEIAWRLLNAIRGTAFSSEACSGAVTGATPPTGGSQLGGTGALLGSRGQLSKVGAPGQRVDALTMSIGGNDVGFANIVASCMIPVYECELDPNVTNGLAADFADLPRRLDEVIAGVQGPTRQVPGDVRHVFVTEYPDPTTGWNHDRCGSFWAPAFEGFEGISEWEAQWASQSVVAPLNAQLSAMVNRANAAPGTHPSWTLVRGISSQFATHGYCTGVGSPNVWVWFNPRFVSTPVDSLSSQGDHLGTMHPNDLGQEVIGEAIFNAIRFLADPLQVSTTTSATAVIGVSVTVTATAVNADGVPEGQVRVSIDGQTAGFTSNAGELSANWTFTSPGQHSVLFDADPFPIAQTTINVVARSYSVSSSPQPIPVGVTIPSLTVTATDLPAGGVFPGNFRIDHGGGILNISSGATVSNAKLQMKPAWVWELDDNGKPYKVFEPKCPTVTFEPWVAGFAPQDVSWLLDCS